MRDFVYYRCSGSDGYRFGGERICSNSQVQGAFLESTVWREVSSLLTNPEKIKLEHQESSKAGTLLGNLEILRSRRVKFDIKSTEAQHYRRFLLQRRTEEKRKGNAQSRPAILGTNTADGIGRAPRGINDGKGFVLSLTWERCSPAGSCPSPPGTYASSR